MLKTIGTNWSRTGKMSKTNSSVKPLKIQMMKICSYLLLYLREKSLNNRPNKIWHFNRCFWSTKRIFKIYKANCHHPTWLDSEVCVPFIAWGSSRSQWKEGKCVDLLFYILKSYIGLYLLYIKSGSYSIIYIWIN